METACIKLDKWAAIHHPLISGVINRNTEEEVKTIDIDGCVKTLRIYWNAQQDFFNFTTLDLHTLASILDLPLLLRNLAQHLQKSKNP